MSRRLANRPRCRKCDRALAPVHAEHAIVEQSTGHTVKTRGAVLGYGYGATGLFCSLTCGHAWAVDHLRDELFLACGHRRDQPVPDCDDCDLDGLRRKRNERLSRSAS